MSTIIVVPHNVVAEYAIQASQVIEVLPDGKYVVNADNALITQLEVNNTPYTLDLKGQVDQLYI